MIFTSGQALPNLRHDPLQLFPAAGGSIEVRGPQARAQQMLPAENVQRQIAVVPVVAVKEPPLLVPMDRIVRGVQIQNDLWRRFSMGLEKDLHQQAIHCRLVHRDLLVAFLLAHRFSRQLQAIQRALARQGLALVALPRPARSRRIGLLCQHRQHRILPKLIVVVQIFIPQRQPVHPLAHQLLHRVLDPLRLPMVRKTSRKLGDDPRALLHLAQQQPPRVAGDGSPVKPPPHLAPAQGMKFQAFLVTLCRQKAVLLLRHNFFSQRNLCHEATAFFNSLVRNRVSQNRFFWGHINEVREEGSDKGQLVGAPVSVGGQGDQQNRDVSDGAEVTS